MILLSAPSPLPSPPLPALSPSHLRSKSLFSSSFLSPSSNQLLRSIDSHLHISLLLSIWVGPKMVLITCHLDYNNSSSLPTFQVFPGGSDGKASAYNAGDLGSIPGLEDPLEKEMATHSSTLAWKIPWMEEPRRLQSMVLQRVGHDWTTSLSFFLSNFMQMTPPLWQKVKRN